MEEYLNKEGLLHRTDGPAVITMGTEMWYKNGELHRTDGPAVILSIGTKKWYNNGKLHRIDGPAIEWYDGEEEYHIFGKEVDEDTIDKINFLKNIKDNGYNKFLMLNNRKFWTKYCDKDGIGRNVDLIRMK